MATPPKFPALQPSTDGTAAGKDVLPWAAGVLDVGGSIRQQLIRLQDWVKWVYIGNTPPKPPAK